VGSIAVGLSTLGPFNLSDGAATLVLLAMHLTVGAVLIRGLLEARALVPGR
jgi:hypothetical protein